MKTRQRNRAVMPQDLARIKQAVDSLTVARGLLREAGSHHAANYVNRALKSAQGAYNNARAHFRNEQGLA